MNRIPLLMAVFVPALLLAQSPFDGAWRFNYDLGKGPEKPFVYSLENGIFSCASCVPVLNVKADGTDQPVPGQANETYNIRVVDAHTVAWIEKKNGKVIDELTRTASNDGRTLTTKVHYAADSDPNSAYQVTYTRVSPAAAGTHAISGSWKYTSGKTTGNAGLIIVKTTADSLSYRSPSSGASYTAKLDGKDYPVTGGGVWTQVSLKRLEGGAIEETSKRGDKVSIVSVWTVSADGSRITEANTNKLTGDHTTSVYERQ